MKRKKERTIFQGIFLNSIACMSAIVLLAVLVVGVFMFQRVVDECGSSQVNTLMQIHSSNIMNRKIMMNVMEAVFDDLPCSVLQEDNADELVNEKLEEVDNSVDALGVSIEVSILMNDKRFYYSENESWAKQLRGTYWYIKHYSGETDESWNLCYIEEEDGTINYGLSYGKTIYDADKKSQGVIIVTSVDQELFGTWNMVELAGENTYILDKNGIIICHTKPQQVGNWKTDIQNFEKDYAPFNKWDIKVKNGKVLLISNYHDESSGWTYVDEQQLGNIMSGGFRTILTCICAILLGTMLISVIAWQRIHHVTRSIESLASSISYMRADRLAPLEIKSSYRETQALRDSFNNMVFRINGLIDEIKIREEEKRKTEYDFLQAQLDPHFLNNTLVAIKSLLAMDEFNQAGKMMEKLIELLNIPASKEIQFVSLREELRLIDDYVAIMNCRTAKTIEVIYYLTVNAEEESIPRMILQPIVGNSIFHGFANKYEDCRIEIKARREAGYLIIEVCDNGEGITEERLQKIKNDEAVQPGKSHHGVGLNNIKRRIAIIYGADSSIAVESTFGDGTRVILSLEDRKR